MENIYIKHVSLQNLWGRYSIEWELDPKVNILVGANGSGKSTILQFITYVLLNDERNRFKIMDEKFMANISISFSIDKRLYSHYNGKVRITDDEPKISNKNSIFFKMCENSTFIDTFDSTVENIQLLNVYESPLSQKLGYLLYGNPAKKERMNFVRHQLKAYEYLLNGREEEGNKMSKQIKLFYDIVNLFFKATKKEIKFESQTLFFLSEGERIELSHLSSGEKQLLIILLNVLFQEGKPAILILDEPEISLDTRWQRILIDKILELNPNCQIIIATHSASVFGNGWMDKVKRMEEILI